MVCAVPEYLRIATAVVALLLGLWGLICAFRNRPPDTSHLVGVIVTEALALALVGTAFAKLAGGHHLTDTATFIGYAGAFLVIPPGGFALARMEPTKWGSAIIAATGIVEAILVVRLQQVWTAR
jgi:hypothetical protein